MCLLPPVLWEEDWYEAKRDYDSKTKKKRDLKCVSDVKANEIKNTDRTQKQTQLENKYGSHLYKTKLKIQIGHENKLRVWQNSHARHNGGIIREVFQRQTLYDI